jgi:hypothetical protein
MNKQEHTQKIIQLLEEVVARTTLINKDPDRELCLEVDLVMEDLRRLYRHYSMLKNICEQGHDFAVKGAASRKEHVPSFFTDPEPPVESKPLPTEDQEPPQRPDKQAATAPESATRSENQEPPAPETATESGNHATPAAGSATGSENQETPAPGSATRSENQETTASDSATGSENQETPAPETATGSVHQEPPFKMEPPRVVPSPTPSARPVPRPASKTASSKGNNGKSIIDMFAENQSKSIGDKLGGEDNSLHQRISSQKEDKSIGARLQQYPISNIREAIGLNEKFLFINELFGGDIDAYHDAINRLNDIGSMKLAFDYLNTLTGMHGWDAGRSAETIEKLANFVQRRYMNA